MMQDIKIFLAFLYGAILTSMYWCCILYIPDSAYGSSDGTAWLWGIPTFLSLPIVIGIPLWIVTNWNKKG